MIRGAESVCTCGGRRGSVRDLQLAAVPLPVGAIVIGLLSVLLGTGDPVTITVTWGFDRSRIGHRGVGIGVGELSYPADIHEIED